MAQTWDIKVNDIQSKLQSKIARLSNEEETADGSIERPKRIGIVMLVVVFGGFGAWGSLAPIEGAAHAPGEVTVKSNTKVVQHLEGGIVSEILVNNGDPVTVGDPLLVMDNTQPRSQLEIVKSQYAALKATEARLLAEQDELPAVEYPQELYSGEFEAAAEINGQNRIFQARRNTLNGSREVLEQRIQQLQSRVEGLRALKATKEQLAASYQEELEDVQTLLQSGFADKTRLRGLERNYATYSGEAAELTATISSTEIEIGEARLQILQEERQFQNEVAGQLSDIQLQLRDVSERYTALNDVMKRTIVRAPENGVVNGMQFHTVGGVIGPGTVIAEIVPQNDELIIEAQAAPVDIDRVAVGQAAMIRFSSFSRHDVPQFHGTVISVSADSMPDAVTGMPYYSVRVAVASEDLADELGDVTLVPGMPAEVFITTGSRTMFSYLFKPFTNAITRSFRED